MQEKWKEELMKREWENNEDLNWNERVKLQKDGLEIFSQLDALTSKEETLTKEEHEWMKWAGLMEQKSPDKEKEGLWQAHVKLPCGMLSAAQAEEIAGLAREFGENTLRFTVRQSVQIQNIKRRDLQEVLSRLHAAGLTTTEAEGDCTRNIIGNPLMGVDPEECIDAMPLVEGLQRLLVGNPEFSNLPRKFKVSVTSEPGDSASAEVNDLSFVPSRAEINGEQVFGFAAYVGGGLASAPRFACRLPYFLNTEDAIRLARAVVTIYRDYGYRVKRSHCRLKYLLEDWGEAKFCSMIDSLEKDLPRGGKEVRAPWRGEVCFGIHSQKQESLCFAGLHIPGDILTGDELKNLADLSLEYGDGTLRVCQGQCVLILNIPKEKTVEFGGRSGQDEQKDAGKKLEQEKLLEKFPLQPGMFSGYGNACVGSEFCRFAAVETRQKLIDVTGELDHMFPELDCPIRIALTGCGAGCAAPQTADIGLKGAHIITEGKASPAYILYVGGTLGEKASLSVQLPGKVPDDRLVDRIAGIIRIYLSERTGGESFHDFVKRVGAERFQ